MPRVVRIAPAPELEPEPEEEAKGLLTALGTAAMVLARWKARVPSEVVLLGGGMRVQGEDAGGDDTVGEAAVLDIAARRLGPSAGAAIPSLLPSFSGDKGSKK